MWIVKNVNFSKMPPLRDYYFSKLLHYELVFDRDSLDGLAQTIIDLTNYFSAKVWTTAYSDRGLFNRPYFFRNKLLPSYGPSTIETDV